jgi:hypothetical protein
MSQSAHPTRQHHHENTQEAWCQYDLVLEPYDLVLNREGNPPQSTALPGGVARDQNEKRATTWPVRGCEPLPLNVFTKP